MQELLDKAHITANKNSIPFDVQPPHLGSGVRFGSPAATTRGMVEEDFTQVGRMIVRLMDEREAAIEDVKEQVIAICEKYPLYKDVM